MVLSAVEYLPHLGALTGRSCTQSLRIGGQQPSPFERAVRMEGACPRRLIAHCYSVHVTMLTVGTRIGSSAAENLDLFKAQGVHAWRSYPAEAGRNPVVCLTGAINAAGELLTPSQRDVVLEELPDAFLKASVLLRCLAYED